MANYGFDLQQKNKSKKTAVFVCVFLCFAVLLGSVSIILLWRSLDYDFNNIFNKADESTTAEQTQETVSQPSYSGNYRFLVSVVSDDKSKTRFINLIDVDLFEKTIKIIPVDSGIKNNKTGKNCSEILKNNGVKELVLFLEEHYNTPINRYAVFTDTGYKSVFRILGDITLSVSENIEYDTPDMFLEMVRGENLLTPEKTFKYMKYLSESKEGYECSELNARVIVAAFNEFYTAESFVYADSLFSDLINQCDTNISIVDYTNAKDELESLVPKTSKEKLKVFVSSKEFINEK